MISVVIATRDDELTIQRAVRSALSQSLPADEVIVVDDKSIDATRRCVLELASERVTLIDGEGRGVSAARNAGIHRARGRWIAFLDGDDYWEADFLHAARERIDASPNAVACFAAATPVDDAGLVVGRHHTRDVVSLEELACGRVVPTTSATLARRDAVVACGGFFEGMRRPAGAEDLDLWLRLAAHGSCVGVQGPRAFYVVHDERDRHRSVEELSELERDRDLVVDRFAASGAPSPLVRRARAIMRARTARYWLRAEQSGRARAAARSSLRGRPSLEGVVTLALASMPRACRQALLIRRRRLRAAGHVRGV